MKLDDTYIGTKVVARGSWFNPYIWVMPVTKDFGIYRAVAKYKKDGSFGYVGFDGQTDEWYLYPEPRKCVVKGCQNHSDQGQFIGDLCGPCYEHVAEGKENQSQAFRNTCEIPSSAERILVALLRHLGGRFVFQNREDVEKGYQNFHTIAVSGLTGEPSKLEVYL